MTLCNTGVWIPVRTSCNFESGITPLMCFSSLVFFHRMASIFPVELHEALLTFPISTPLQEERSSLWLCSRTKVATHNVVSKDVSSPITDTKSKWNEPSYQGVRLLHSLKQADHIVHVTLLLFCGNWSSFDQLRWVLAKPSTRTQSHMDKTRKKS